MVYLIDKLQITGFPDRRVAIDPSKISSIADAVKDCRVRMVGGEEYFYAGSIEEFIEALKEIDILRMKSMTRVIPV